MKYIWYIYQCCTYGPTRSCQRNLPKSKKSLKKWKGTVPVLPNSYGLSTVQPVYSDMALFPGSWSYTVHMSVSVCKGRGMQKLEVQENLHQIHTAFCSETRVGYWDQARHYFWMLPKQCVGGYCPEYTTYMCMYLRLVARTKSALHSGYWICSTHTQLTFVMYVYLELL